MHMRTQLRTSPCDSGFTRNTFAKPAEKMMHWLPVLHADARATEPHDRSYAQFSAAQRSHYGGGLLQRSRPDGSTNKLRA